MALVNLKSQVVTDLDTVPVAKLNPIKQGGVMREASGFVTTNSDDNIGSTYRMCRVPSRARITEVLLTSNGGSTAGAGDIGLYRTTADGGAVVDVDFFQAAEAINTPAKNHVDVTYEAAATPLNNLRLRPLWAQLGLATDPRVDYDVVVTLTTATTVAATIFSIKVRYVLDE